MVPKADMSIVSQQQHHCTLWNENFAVNQVKVPEWLTEPEIVDITVQWAQQALANCIFLVSKFIEFTFYL